MRRRVFGFAPRATLAALALAGLGMGASPARAYLPTHGMMLDSLAATVAADLLRGQASDRAVAVVVPLEGDTSGLLAQRLLERLRSVTSDVRVRERPLATPGAQPPTMPPGMPPAVPASDSGSAPLELHARVDGAGVSYVRRIRSFPFGVKGYERLVTMRASATMLEQGTGRVVWARSATASLQDVVRKRDLAYVSGGSTGWNPPLPQGTGPRILEPLIVVGVVAGLVVLFYSNRN
ncbi:MAG TPA: hypothetical protein VE326_09275 [Candidatus Binatia bacterium]|nr:hypothetical protein [Candidatus Binatia bacterium]